MICTRHEVQYVAITFEDKSIAVMQFITAAHSKTGKTWSRDASDEAIAIEIAKSSFPKVVASWRKIDPNDLPGDRDNRDAWVDNGGRIVVNPTKIKPPGKDLEERIAALEASVALAARSRD